MFSSVDLSLAAVKMSQKFTFTGGFRYDLQNHRRLPGSIFRVQITAVGSLKRVIERMFKSKKFFRGKMQNIILRFFATTRHQTSPVTYLIKYVDLKTILHLMTQSLSAIKK